MEEVHIKTNIGYSIVVTFIKAQELSYFMEWAKKSKNIKTKRKLVKHCYKLINKRNFVASNVVRS